MEDFLMSIRSTFFRLISPLMMGFLFFCSHAAMASDSLTLYTPFTKISVPPGEAVDYTIDVINTSKVIKNVDLAISGMPAGWNYDLKVGSWNIRQISILPGEKKSLSLKVEVPLQVNKGNYGFRVIAGSYSVLPLVINVSKQGMFKTEFTTNQANQEGHAKSTFSFNATLKNRTADRQSYAFMANTSPGWEVTFKVNYKQTTSVDLDPNNTSNIVIEIKPPDNIDAGKYEIPVRATTNSSSAELNLQVVITGSYNMELTTPTGLLSTKITAGESKKVELAVKNTGTTILSNINLSYGGPAGWEVTFEPKKIDNLMAGKVMQVYASIKADKRAIPGDYMTNIEAQTTEVTAKTSIRVSVGTSMLWGWIGVLIILIALGGVYYLFRKYGRR